MALYGKIKRICQKPDELQGKMISTRPDNKDDNDVLVVEHYGLKAWKTTPDGNPIKFRYESRNFDVKHPLVAFEIDLDQKS